MQPISLAHPEAQALVAVIGMALATYATRAGGFWLMRLVPMTPVLEAFLRGMAGSVVVAIIVPQALKGDWPARAAIAASLIVMIGSRQPVAAMIAGIAVAGLWRALI
ncbi:MAG: AzlD domain-containing protein [Hyphomicrobiaceae bacterium]